VPDPVHPSIHLPIDEEIEAAYRASPEDLPAALDELSAHSEMADDRRALWGLTRALARREDVLEALTSEREMIVAEFNARAEIVRRETVQLRQSIETIVLRMRESGRGGNFYDAPGDGGRWSTRLVRGGWRIADESALVWALEGDDRAAFTFEPPPVQPRRALRRDQFIAMLDGLLDLSDLDPEKSSDREKIGALGNAIAAAYPGVEFRPPRISVSQS
jgi:hypothetical protein